MNVICNKDSIIKLTHLLSKGNWDNTIKGANGEMISSQTPNISVSVQWMAIDGNLTNEFSQLNLLTNKNKNKNKNLQNVQNVQDGGSHGSHGSSRAVANVSPILSHSLSKEQQVFYESLCQNILNCNNESLMKICQIIETCDAGLAHLIPHIRTFIS